MHLEMPRQIALGGYGRNRVSAISGFESHGFAPQPSRRPRWPLVDEQLVGLGELSYTLTPFRGADHTLEVMRAQALGARGEEHPLVRDAAVDIIRRVWPKDYLGEILAIRHWVAEHCLFVNDPLHVEFVRDPLALLEQIDKYGVTRADCDELAELIATLGLCIGRYAELIAVGFGQPGLYTHVFARLKEPKTSEWIICDPVAGTDERQMANRVTTYKIWSLDEEN